MERSCFTNCINPNVNCVKVISSLFLSLELDILTLRKHSREFIFISILFLQIPIFCFETLLPKELQLLWFFVLDIGIFEFRMSDASDSGSSLNSGDESLSDNDQDRASNFFEFSTGYVKGRGQSCKIDCENCDYCEIANCDCDEIAISQTTQSDYWEGCAISQTKQSDFLDSRNC